ncbi:MAG: DUF3313 family protein [Verrucomicrobia bacterium]|nr:DUF3313 family protein [Verrucomicrobiota bacterium]
MKLISSIGFAVFWATLAGAAQAGVLKAPPAPPTGFLDHPQAMSADPARAPFNKAWESPRARDRVRGFNRVVIAPVNTAYVKATPQQRAEVEKLAAFMREQFQSEFAKGGKFRVVNQSGPRTLKLELALVQFQPTNVAGNVLSTGAGAVVPGARILGSQFTHGVIAFEAKLRNAETGELLAEYADRQKDKISLLSFRDYSADGHGRRAIQDWARQMEQLASTPSNHKVPGAMRVTLNPF